MSVPPSCTCGALKIGTETVAYNLNYDCPDHGTDSEWYNDPVQAAKREKDNFELRQLQMLARQRRMEARRGQPG